MHIEIDNVIDFRDEKDSFNNFIYEDESQYLRCVKNGSELNIINTKNFPNLKIVVANELSPMFFQKHEDRFVAKCQDLKFGKNNKEELITKQFAYFLENNDIHFELKVSGTESSSYVSNRVQTYYSKFENNNQKSRIEFLGSILKMFQSSANFSFYNLGTKQKIQNNISNKIEIPETGLKIIGDDGDRLLEISITKNGSSDSFLNFFHKSRQVFLFEIFSQNTKENYYNVVYSSKSRDISTVMNEYGIPVAWQIFGRIRTCVFIIFTHINKVVNNDSWSAIITYEAMILLFFLFLFLLLFIVKKFVGKERIWYSKPNGGYINDNNSKINSSLHFILLISNFPLFMIFAMMMPYTWSGFEFTGNLFGNMKLSSIDTILFNTPLFAVSITRIFLVIVFLLTGFFNENQKSKNQDITSKLAQSLFFATLMAVLIGRVNEPIIAPIFLSILLLNKLVMYFNLRTIFNVTSGNNNFNGF